MNIPTFCICLFFTSFSGSVIAQSVEVTRQSAFEPHEPVKALAFMEPATDTAQFAFVASLKAAGDQRSGVESLYSRLRDKALQLGANAFRMTAYQPGDSTHSSFLLMDCYYGTDTALRRNEGNHEKNVVYIFGSTKTTDKAYTCKVDNVKKELKPGSYLRQPVAKGHELKIGKGGMIGGATLWIKWAENRSATFLTLSGLGLAPTPQTPGQVNVGFTFASINYMEDGLGYLLVSVLKKAE